MAITDLTGTKWILNSNLGTTTPAGTEYNYGIGHSFNEQYLLNFASNSNNYVKLLFHGIGEGGDTALIYDSTYINNYLSSGGADSWEDEAYRTIEITGGTDATNTNLIAWLSQNATYQTPSTPNITFGPLSIEKIYFGDLQVLNLSWGPTMLYEYEPTPPTPVIVYSITTTVTNGSYSGASTINNGGTATVTITADTGYTLPASITVTGASYTYSSSTGVIELNNPTTNVTISVVCEAIQGGYSITKNAVNMILDGPDYINEGETVVLNIVLNEGCVQLAGKTAFDIVGATGTYDATNKTYTITNPTGNVVINAKTPKYEILFNLENTSGSSITKTYSFSMIAVNSAVYYDGNKIWQGSSETASIEITIPDTSSSGPKVLKILGTDHIYGNSNDSYPEIISAIDNSTFGVDLQNISNIQNIYFNCDDLTEDTNDRYVDLLSLQSITLGPNVSVFVPRSNTAIGSYPLFKNCGTPSITVDTNNQYFYSEGGAVYDKITHDLIWAAYVTSWTAPQNIGSKIRGGAFTDARCTSLVFPAVITESDYACAENTILNSVVLNSHTIGQYMFAHCSSLSSVAFSNSVIEILSDAFTGCNALTSLELSSSIERISSGFVSEGNTGLRNNGKITDDGTCKYLKVGNNPYYAQICFSTTISGQFTIQPGCVLLVTGAAGLGQYVTSATIPGSVKRIPNHYFVSCTKLGSVTLNEGLLEIGAEAFNGYAEADYFTSIVIPSTVTKIGDGAFANTSGSKPITSITFNEDPTTAITFGTNVFKVKTARTMTINHKGNMSVTSYNWSGDNITPSFVVN